MERRELLEREIDLVTLNGLSGPGGKTISTFNRLETEEISTFFCVRGELLWHGFWKNALESPGMGADQERLFLLCWQDVPVTSSLTALPEQGKNGARRRVLYMYSVRKNIAVKGFFMLDTKPLFG